MKIFNRNTENRIGDAEMQVSPISSYRSSSQTFEAYERPRESASQVAFAGSERPPHGAVSWGKRVVAAVMLGLVALFGGNAIAQTAKTDTALVAENKTSAKPIIFAQEAFYIDNATKQLKVAAVNTKGDTSGFNFILCNLINRLDNTSSKWWVAGVMQPSEGSHLKPWVYFAKLGDDGAKPLSIFDEKVVAYVVGLLNDARNLTGAEVKQATKAVVTAMKQM